MSASYDGVMDMVGWYDEEKDIVGPSPVYLSPDAAREIGVYDKLIAHETERESGMSRLMQMRYYPEGAPPPVEEKKTTMYKGRRLVLDETKNKYYAPFRILVDEDLTGKSIRVEDSILGIE